MALSSHVDSAVPVFGRSASKSTSFKLIGVLPSRLNTTSDDSTRSLCP